MNILKLFRDCQLWLDHVEEEGGGHDCTAVHLEYCSRCELTWTQHHRVVWLFAVVQGNLIELSPTGLLANKLVNHFGSKLVESEGVSERFACGLDGEGLLGVTDGEPGGKTYRN